MSEKLYLSFGEFCSRLESAPVQRFTSAGITLGSRRFWNKKLARYLGKKGKPIRYFLDPCSPFGEEAVVFSTSGEYITSAPEIGKPSVPSCL